MRSCRLGGIRRVRVLGSVVMLNRTEPGAIRTGSIAARRGGAIGRAQELDVTGESGEPEVEDLPILHVAEPVLVGVRTPQRDDAAFAQPSELVTPKHAPRRFARILVEDPLQVVHCWRFLPCTHRVRGLSETKRAPEMGALRSSGSVEIRSGPANQPSLVMGAEVGRHRSGAIYCCLECITAVELAVAILRPVASAATGIVLGEAVAAGAEHEIVHRKASSARIGDRPPLGSHRSLRRAFRRASSSPRPMFPRHDLVNVGTSGSSRVDSDDAFAYSSARRPGGCVGQAALRLYARPRAPPATVGDSPGRPSVRPGSNLASVPWYSLDSAGNGIGYNGRSGNPILVLRSEATSPREMHRIVVCHLIDVSALPVYDPRELAHTDMAQRFCPTFFQASLFFWKRKESFPRHLCTEMII